MCPYEDAVALNYYTPGKHLIDENVLTALTALGVNDDLMKVLSSDQKGKFGVDVLNVDLDLGIANDLLDLIGGFLFDVPQIKERQFSKTYELRDAVYKYINMSVSILPGDRMMGSVCLITWAM